MDGGSFLQQFEVIFFVAGMLIQDEEVRSQQADCESQVELPNDAHLGEVLLRFRTDEHGLFLISSMLHTKVTGSAATKNAFVERTTR